MAREKKIDKTNKITLAYSSMEDKEKIKSWALDAKMFYIIGCQNLANDMPKQTLQQVNNETKYGEMIKTRLS